MAIDNLTTDDLLAAGQDRILAPNDLTFEGLDRALTDLLGNGADYADLYFQSGHSESWRLTDEKVTSAGFAISEGVGARSVSGEQTAFAHSSAMKPEALTAAIGAVRSMLVHGNDKVREGGVAITSQAPRPLMYPVIDPAESLPSAEKVRILQMIDQKCRAADPRIVKVSANLDASYETILIAGSNGMRAADIRPLVSVSVCVVAQQGERRGSGSAVTSGRYDLADLDQERLDELIATATRIALVNLDARPAPSGPMSVVLGSGFPGVLLHEAVGHGLEADAHRKRSSVFTGLEGSQIAAKGVTVIDDGNRPTLRGSLNVDDEGTPTGSNVLIEDGRLVGLMHDLTSARMLGLKPTGNARRQSYSQLPMPRMTNTFLAQGNYPREEIIASVKKGIYAPEFGGGQVDITSGQFNFSATEAYLIENGRITAPIRGAVLIGSGHEALKHLSMVGDDLRFAGGVCGKDGQSVPVCVGQPTVRIDNVTVGGTN